MPLYQVSWTSKHTEMTGSGSRISRKIVAEGPIAATLKAGHGRKRHHYEDMIDVEVEQLDSEHAWNDKNAPGSGIVSRVIDTVRSITISPAERFTLAAWLKDPVPGVNHMILGPGNRLVFEENEDAGMGIKVLGK